MSTSMAAELDRLTVDTAALRRMAALAQSELQAAGLRRAQFEPDVLASLEALAASILASEDGRYAALEFFGHAIPVLARTPQQQATLVAWSEGAAAASLVNEIFGSVVQYERSMAPMLADLGGTEAGLDQLDRPREGRKASVAIKAATPQRKWGEALADIWQGLSEALSRLGLGLSRSKRRARLVRKAVSALASRLTLSLPAVRAAGPAASLRLAATSAIQRIPTPTQRLDVERTFRASLRNGGIFSPVFRTRPVGVEYLFLVRQLSSSDLEYVRVEAILKELKGQGVPLSYYPYRADPRRVLETMSGARTATLGLEQLYERHPHARLILVTEGRELVNGFTLQPHAWMRRLDLWPLHALVTPLPRSDWGTIEARIHFDLDYAITSSRDGGLDRLGRLFSGRSPYADPESPMRTRSSPSFVTSPSLSLVSEQPPSEEECDALLVELMTHLGPRGFHWLGICAHFPAMSPELALHYGRALFADEERHDAFGATFARLSGLPWMRYGAMPYWARRLIVSALQAEQRAAAQALIAATLDPKNLTVETASTTPPLFSAWQLAGDKCLALPIRVDGDGAGGGFDLDELAITFLADGSEHDLDPILKLKPAQIVKLVEAAKRNAVAARASTLRPDKTATKAGKVDDGDGNTSTAGKEAQQDRGASIEGGGDEVQSLSSAQAHEDIAKLAEFELMLSRNFYSADEVSKSLAQLAKYISALPPPTVKAILFRTALRDLYRLGYPHATFYGGETRYTFAKGVVFPLIARVQACLPLIWAPSLYSDLRLRLSSITPRDPENIVSSTRGPTATFGAYRALGKIVRTFDSFNSEGSDGLRDFIILDSENASESIRSFIEDVRHGDHNWRATLETPLWRSGAPSRLSTYGSGLVNSLNALPGGDVWISWLNERERGDPINMGLELARAIEVSVDDWAAGPERVNARIKHILEGDRTEKGGSSESGLGSNADAIRIFLEGAGWGGLELRPITGEAAIRRYYRLERGDERALLIIAPRQPDGPPIREGKPYSRIAHLAEDMRPFVAVANHLRAHGLSAPAVFAQDLDAGFLLIEDLGDRVFLGEVAKGSDQRQLWRAGVDALVVLAGVPVVPALTVIGSETYTLPLFDRAAMQIEVELMLDWYVPAVTGAPASDAARGEFNVIWNAVFDRLQLLRPALLLRDYQSTNLLLLPSRRGAARVGIIDFQDAVLGPPAYDLVSLLQDARVDVAESLEAELYAHYINEAQNADPEFDRIRFEFAYASLGAQRNTKILGIFTRLAWRDGKSQYLEHIPRIWRYLDRDLKHSGLVGLRAWYDRWLPDEVRNRPPAR